MDLITMKKELLSFYNVKKFEQIDMENWINISKEEGKIPSFLRGKSIPEKFLNSFIEYLDIESLLLYRNINASKILEKHFDKIKNFLYFINWNKLKNKDIFLKKDLILKLNEFYFKKFNESWFNFITLTQYINDDIFYFSLLNTAERTKKIVYFRYNFLENNKIRKEKKEEYFSFLDKISKQIDKKG